MIKTYCKLIKNIELSSWWWREREEKYISRSNFFLFFILLHPSYFSSHFLNIDFCHITQLTNFWTIIFLAQSCHLVGFTSQKCLRFIVNKKNGAQSSYWHHFAAFFSSLSYFPKHQCMWTNLLIFFGPSVIMAFNSYRHSRCRRNRNDENSKKNKKKRQQFNWRQKFHIWVASMYSNKKATRSAESIEI